MVAKQSLKGSSTNSSSTSSASRAWEALTPPLAQWILSATSSLGFHRMTPVQANCIPLFMGHKDVVVEAVTGSGKTLAFLIPLVEKILRLEERTKKHHVAAIIVSPTTELARQIYTVLSSLLAFHAPSAAASRPLEDLDRPPEGQEDVGDTPAYPSNTPIVLPQLLVAGQITPAQDLSNFLRQSPNVLIATPGRLLEVLSSSRVHCPQSSFEVLVLDEADRLLDMGFKDDLQRIIRQLPKQRRTGLFSATVTESVDQIIRVGLRNPVKIAVKVRSLNGTEEQKTPASLQMTYLTVPATQKLPAILSILSTLDPTPQKAILYVSTCAAVDYYQHILRPLLPTISGQPITLVPLHGKQPQKVRVRNFSNFSASIDPTLLLTTDVAARGLDIPSVDLVLQLDPPTDPKVFLHRCGRAGRAGRKGLSILLLLPGREEDYLPFLSIRRTPLTPYNLPPSIDLPAQAAKVTSHIREIVLKDRALHDKAQRAFVSWARSYSAHLASSIFRIGDIDWEDQGMAWGLLKLPSMPELRTFKGDRSLGVQINWQEYGYKDPAQEEARQRALAAPPEETKKNGKGGQKDGKKAWSANNDRTLHRQERREQRAKKKEKIRWERMTPRQREEQKELNMMIEKVRAQNQVREDVFEGFE